MAGGSKAELYLNTLATSDTMRTRSSAALAVRGSDRRVLIHAHSTLPSSFSYGEMSRPSLTRTEIDVNAATDGTTSPERAMKNSDWMMMHLSIE